MEQHESKPVLASVAKLAASVSTGVPPQQHVQGLGRMTSGLSTCRTRREWLSTDAYSLTHPGLPSGVLAPFLILPGSVCARATPGCQSDAGKTVRGPCAEPSEEGTPGGGWSSRWPHTALPKPRRHLGNTRHGPHVSFISPVHLHGFA